MMCRPLIIPFIRAIFLIPVWSYCMFMSLKDEEENEVETNTV